MRTVVITGCASAVGRETARAFLDEEWRVYATARDPRDIADLEEAGCATATLDVTDDEQVEGVIDRIDDEAGRIDCLVNAAGTARFGPLEDVSAADLHEQFDVNVYGPHRLARAVLPHMREREDGTIVTLSSVVGRVSVPGTGAYAGPMFAVEAMSDALRAEVSPFGIDVVVVDPGPMEPNRFDGGRTNPEDSGDRTEAYASLYRLLEDSRLVGSDRPFRSDPAEVAGAILNAASSTDPQPRYAVGPVANTVGLARLLPARLRDRAYRLATSFVR